MSQKLWVVQQLNWHVYGRECQDREREHGLPVGVFTSRKKAKAFCQTLEEQARSELSPFQFFEEVEMVSDLDEEQVIKRIQALGLPAPVTYQEEHSWGTYTKSDWHGWWDQHSPDLTEEQRAGIWKLFPRLQFYEVVATEYESEL